MELLEDLPLQRFKGFGEYSQEWSTGVGQTWAGPTGEPGGYNSKQLLQSLISHVLDTFSHLWPMNSFSGLLAG